MILALQVQTPSGWETINQRTVDPKDLAESVIKFSALVRLQNGWDRSRVFPPIGYRIVRLDRSRKDSDPAVG